MKTIYQNSLFHFSGMQLSRLHSTALVVVALLGFQLTAGAQTFSTKSAGKYNDRDIWTPEYPGNVIDQGASVKINHHVKLNSDVIIKGEVAIAKDASVMGSKNVIILETGLLVNEGITVVEHITNRGMLQNQRILESSADLVNTGQFVNNQSVVVGNIFDNIGTITGDGGQFVAGKKMINSQGGTLAGNIDLCANTLMNVDGGMLDSLNVSFCGNRIFNGMFLTASLSKEAIHLKLMNSDTEVYDTYEILRSTDGRDYDVIASIKGDDLEKEGFEFFDKDRIAGQFVYYKMNLLDQAGRLQQIPMIEVNNLLSGVRN